jgi:hypothetical protein
MRWLICDEIVLQHAYAPRQGGRRNTQPFGGGVEAAVVCYRDEVFERDELHGRIADQGVTASEAAPMRSLSTFNLQALRRRLQ